MVVGMKNEWDLSPPKEEPISSIWGLMSICVQWCIATVSLAAASAWNDWSVWANVASIALCVLGWLEPVSMAFKMQAKGTW